MEKDHLKKKKNKNWFNEYLRWPLIVLAVSLFLSFTFSFLSELALNGASLVIAIIVIVVFMFISVITDIIGVAVTAAVEVPFRAMAAKKVKGAKESIILINNADKVSSIIADILGDICSILSGAAGAVVTAKLISGVVDELAVVIIASVVSATIAGIIIFGKAMGKRIALDNCDNIVLMLGKIVYVFTFGKLSIKNKN
jgi:CBS domain containing-hemolysin-like protein